MIVDLVGWIVLLVSVVCLVTGAFCSVVGGLGLVRLPDFYARLHSGGVTDTAGAGLILCGLMVYSGFNLVTLKLIVILLFFVITSPSACHALARSAMDHGVKPEVDEPTIGES